MRPSSVAAPIMACGTYLTLLPGQGEHGLPITQVREIIGIQSVATIPDQPSQVDGVINLRSRILPAINLRRAFGMAPDTADGWQVSIVVDGGRDGRVGLAADQVKEVVTFRPEDVEPPPRLASDGSLVAGIGKSQGRIRILLALDHRTNDV